jgi:hypothetical protein
VVDGNGLLYSEVDKSGPGMGMPTMEILSAEVLSDIIKPIPAGLEF